MNPNKIKWYLGASSLSVLMEQDRKHWLLKTDKTKQVQDTVTGDTFLGQIDNLGSDIVIETEKEFTEDYVVKNGTFFSENVSDVLEISRSVFPYIPKLNGLYFARLKSINLDIGGNYHNFRMILKNTRIIFVPMASDPEAGTVTVYRWARTYTNPILQVDDGNGGTIDTIVSFGNGISVPVFYYPLEPAIIPIELVTTIPSNPQFNVSQLTTITIVNDEDIGKPLFWFSCYESDNGPALDMLGAISAISSVESMCLEVGHKSDESMYQQHIYPATGVAIGSAPDGMIHEWIMKCAPANGKQFTNDATDFNKPITDIVFVKIDQYGEEIGNIFNMDITNKTGNNIITMTNNGKWEYVDEYTYKVRVDAYEDNLYVNQNDLIPAFDVAMDQNVSFMNTTTNIGYAGIRMGSSKNVSEQLPRYPHDITNMKGLPDWLNSENATPQHMSMYAIHNTPFYDPKEQDTRQIAGLIFDPGVERSYDSRFFPGQYRILNVDIIKKGSNYNYGVGWWQNGNRVRVRLNNDTETYTFFEITGVDANGGVTSIEPLYLDEGDEVSQFFRGFFDPQTNAFYYNPQFTGNPIEAFDRSRYVDLGARRVYRCNKISSDDIYYELTNDSPDIQPWGEGSALESTYDPVTLTGNYLNTRPNVSTYSYEEIAAVRDAWYAGTGDGIMPEKPGVPDPQMWYLYTTATGSGLVLGITLEYIQEVAPPITSDNIPPEQIGRVYVLSNDSPTYINNAKAENPKPERTLARICDIPTSVMQLSNIHGLAPTSVVDKKYIRSEASYTEEDQDYLYNGSRSLWVRPIHLDGRGHPITSQEGQTNHFVFDSMELLNMVDLENYNDFRKTINLNRQVDPNHVHIETIAEAGSGYSVGSIGIIVVGGYSFIYNVDAVNDMGGVTAATLAPNDQSDTKISLANFDLIEGTGRTLVYGTSPLDSVSGTGLKVNLIIDNYNSLKPKKGDIFEDLYAFVRDTKGIWLCTYREQQWVKLEIVAQSNYSETIKTQGHVSLKDSYINSILPSIRSFTVNPKDPYRTDVSLDAFQTASSINVIDDNKTPVWVPSASNTSELIDDRTVIDINKLYCTQVGSLIATNRNEAGVIQAINNINDGRFDSYIFWKWDDPQDTSNCKFTYGIIHRSLDNIQSTDSTSTLPDNDLINQNFVHTNAQTTIMWNVPHVGPMVWMFNPYSNIHEEYYVDAHTRELYVIRNTFAWKDVEIIYSDGDDSRTINLVDENGFMLYNIITNNPAMVNADQSSIIYQQPDYQNILSIGDDAQNKKLPTGSWELVFPSNTHSFKLKGVYDDQSEYTPVKMNVIRGADISNTSDVLNSEGIPVNYKTLLIDENSQTGKLSMRIYNQETGQWLNV